MATIRDARKVKEHEHGKLYGKPNHQFELSLIGDIDHFPKDCYVTTRTRAQGSYGKIRLGMSCDGKDDKLLAIKELRTADKSGVSKLTGGAKTAKTDLDDIKREMDVMELAKCKLRFIDLLKIETKDKKSFNYYAVMPAMAGSLYDLRDLFEKEKTSDAERRLIGRYVMREVAADLENCHGANRIHNDMKPDNILFSAETVALMDFGLATNLKDASAGMVPVRGSPAYWPWEMIGDPQTIGRYGISWDGKFDLYALAMIWGELLVPPSDDYHNGSTLWIPSNAPLTPDPDLTFRKDLSGPDYAWFPGLAKLRSMFISWYNDKGGADSLEDLAKKKAWTDPKSKNTFDAGFARLYSIDKALLSFAWTHMFHFDPKERCSAKKVKDRAALLLKKAGGELKARGLLAKLAKRLPDAEEHEHIRTALRMAREELKQTGGKLGPGTKPKPLIVPPPKPAPIIAKPKPAPVVTKPTKPLTVAKPIWKCRYCGATFKYKPIWCKCHRPANTADGPTFEELEVKA